MARWNWFTGLRGNALTTPTRTESESHARRADGPAGLGAIWAAQSRGELCNPQSSSSGSETLCPFSRRSLRIFWPPQWASWSRVFCANTWREAIALSAHKQLRIIGEQESNTGLDILSTCKLLRSNNLKALSHYHLQPLKNVHLVFSAEKWGDGISSPFRHNSPGYSLTIVQIILTNYTHFFMAITSVCSTGLNVNCSRMSASWTRDLTVL